MFLRARAVNREPDAGRLCVDGESFIAATPRLIGS